MYHYGRDPIRACEDTTRYKYLVRDTTKNHVIGRAYWPNKLVN